MVRSDCFLFLRKILGRKIITLQLFPKFVYLVFLKLYLMTSINKWTKMTVLNFKRKFILCSKWLNCSSVRTRGPLLFCTCYGSPSVSVGVWKHLSYFFWKIKYLHEITMLLGHLPRNCNCSIGVFNFTINFCFINQSFACLKAAWRYLQGDSLTNVIHHQLPTYLT